MSLEERIARIEKGIAYLRGIVEQMYNCIIMRLSRLENVIVHLRTELDTLANYGMT